MGCLHVNKIYSKRFYKVSDELEFSEANSLLAYS